MVICCGAGTKTVIEINETDAQPVSSAATTGPLGAPNLRGPNYDRVWRPR